MSADDAVNYGAIGAVIGHEISHGFDDKGSQYDGEGNLRNWWTQATRMRSPLGQRRWPISTQPTSPSPATPSTESSPARNIADVSGLAVALRAYRRSLKGAEAPGDRRHDGEQRLQVGRRCGERRRVSRRRSVGSHRPHSPPEYRVLGVLVNNDDFAAAFDDETWRRHVARAE